MKKLLLISLLGTITISGCATQQSQLFSEAKITYHKPNIIQVPVINNNYHLIYGNDPSLERAFNQYVKSGKAANIVTDGFIKFAYNAGQQPIVKTTPFQETVISLQPGEKFTNVTSGDPNRWSYSVALSGSGSSQQQNILVKPSLPNLSTNMVITTDRRIYNLKLISTMDASSTRNVTFWYPEEMINVLNTNAVNQNSDTSIASVPDVNLNNLNFNYEISSDGFFRALPSWSPRRVFDDGTHTYMQFPYDVSNRDMPVLFIQNGDNKELVNYRFKSPYFVVDKIFKEAVLVMGVGHDQTKVFIKNKNYA